MRYDLDKIENSEKGFLDKIAKTLWLCDNDRECVKNKKKNNDQQDSAELEKGQPLGDIGEPSSRVNEAWQDLKKSIYKRVSLDCESEECLDSAPFLQPIEHEVTGDPPNGLSIRGLSTEAKNISAYQVKRDWSSGTIQTGFIATSGEKANIYEAAYFAIYPSSYGFSSEKFAGAAPFSINFGFAKKSLWNAYDDSDLPDDIDDSKFILGVGYTLANAKELFSIQVGRVYGDLDWKRLSEPYVGASLDIMKVLSKLSSDDS